MFFLLHLLNKKIDFLHFGHYDKTFKSDFITVDKVSTAACLLSLLIKYWIQILLFKIFPASVSENGIWLAFVAGISGWELLWQQGRSGIGARLAAAAVWSAAVRAPHAASRRAGCGPGHPGGGNRWGITINVPHKSSGLQLMRLL